MFDLCIILFGIESTCIFCHYHNGSHFLYLGNENLHIKLLQWFIEKEKKLIFGLNLFKDIYSENNENRGMGGVEFGDSFSFSHIYQLQLFSKFILIHF